MPVVPNVRSLVPFLSRRTAFASIGLAAAACATDAPIGPGRPAVLERVSGDGQTAPPGSALERPLVARLLDADGRPVRRAEVHWTATSGEVTPNVSATDASGEAKAVWRLGTQSGEQLATATADGIAPVQFVAYVDPGALPDRIPLRAIDLTTYEGSGQVVHPDIAFPAFDESGRAPMLAITPYPLGNSNFENPSLFTGNGRDAWTIPEGVTNPVVKPNGGYLSDPDIVWVDDRRELWLYYRHVAQENEVLLTRSSDGLRWSAPEVVVRVPSHQAVSPTVVRRAANDWMMWTVNSGAAGCGSASTTVEARRSSDGVTWSPPVTVSLSQPGVFAWHIDVQWMPTLNEYWALYNGKVAGSCTTEALYIATSPDGVNWRTFRSPVLRRGAIPEFADIVYRATFAYDPERDLVSLWHSGARATSRGYEWHAAFERRPRSDLFDSVARLESAAIIPTSAPPLTNETAP